MHDTAYFRVKCVAFFLFTLAGISLLWLGCGKKGPPRPPPQTLPAAVKDLSYQIDNDMVKLKWTVTGTNDHSPSYPAAVKLFRFKQSAEESSCERCPIRFSEIADLPVQLKRSGQSESSTMSFTEVLERGYRYIYKVIVYNRDGLGSKDSNPVEFSF
jgi:hypothetical protein